ncbi:ubiquitin carboxyl-terminal hydrolase 37-like [Clytia hemisphaerica]|uniref:Ubiquitin carboxyl-terminal hydrolase n=1 Tax=Clytia hemisphaerica TaxID=252671 RepID=A0A7M6DK02_9CNID|eukprot:TCONS_00071078-protein
MSLFSAGPNIEVIKTTGQKLKISTSSRLGHIIDGKGELVLMRSKNGNSFSLNIKNDTGTKKDSFKFNYPKDSVKCSFRENQLCFTYTIKTTNIKTGIISGEILDLKSFKEFNSLMKQMETKRFKPIEIVSSGSNINATKPSIQSLSQKNRSFEYCSNTETETGSFKTEQNAITPKRESDNMNSKENTPKSIPKRMAMKMKGGEDNRKPLDTLKTKQFYSKDTNTPKREVKSNFPVYSQSKFNKIPKFIKNRLPSPIPFRKNKEKITRESNESIEDFFEDDNSLIGFANLGNTCYMNAILQCLLNIPNFYQELHNQNNLAVLPKESLYKRLCQLGFAKHNLQGSETQKQHLQLVKESISSAANRFSGYSQHDAHEFLCQCMDQLKEDLLTQMTKKKEEMQLSIEELKSVFVCPIKENLETTVTHSIRCLGCKEKVIKDEEYHDFSLVIPEYDENFNPGTLSIEKLLNLYFADEEIEYTCEKCQNSSSVLTHQMKKLPRILVLHLKRYDSYEMKKSDSIKIPKIMDISKVVSDEVAFPSDFNLDCSLWKDSTTLKSGVKRKSEDSSFLSNAPLNKTPKVNRNSYINEMSAAEILAISARESRKEESNSSYSNPSHSFTKIQGPRKTLTFTSDSEFDSNMEVKTEPKLSPEEQQIKEAMELSIQEYKSQQRLDMSTFSLSKQTSTPSSIKTEPFFQVLSSDSDAITDEKQTYRLVGVVNHHGMNTASGHYTCDCYDFKSKQWRNYNDSSVKEMDEYDWNRRSSSAYIVFYMHDKCYQSIQNKY